ncbi:hypothetical protein ABTL44_19695, partial [Acinetobacter baumannii]
MASKLQLNQCPVCESPLEDGHAAPTDPSAGESIEAQRAAIAAAEADLEAMIQPLKEAEESYSSTAAELV